MGHIPLLDELALIAGLAVLVTVLLARLKLPTVAGLLFAGALVGPYGLGLVRSVTTIELLAEIGVVMLLFTIGLEFSLARLRHILRQVALGGLVQVGLTVACTVLVCAALGVPLKRGMFFGFLFALSSTAIVLRALNDRRELDAPHGRFIVGTLIFQDLCVVPMVLIVPLLASGSDLSRMTSELSWALAKATVIVVLLLASARYLAPQLLRWVTASGSREIFLLAVLALCTGTAWLTSLAGLSLALGAFLGGMVVADTDYGHRALGDMLPLRDTFVSIFFVSLGMLFDLRVVFAMPGLVLAILVGLVVVKGFLATLSAVVMRFPARVAWLAGVGLAQFGEFGFVLGKLGVQSGVVSNADMAPVLMAGIASMFLTPVLVRVAPHVTAGERLLAPLERLIGVRGIDEADAGGKALVGHVVVVGFGVAGRVIVRALSASEVPYVVLELNADTVRGARAAGEPVYYADATSEEALGHACLKAARALVLVMSDAAAAQRVVDTAKRVAPEVPILVRSRYLAEKPALAKLGAEDVVAEEVEGAMEVLVRLMRWLELPRNRIHARVREARESTQTSEREVTMPRSSLDKHGALADLKIDSLAIEPDSHAAGRSLIDLSLRSRTGALIVAVRRAGELLEPFDPTTPLLPADVVYVVGSSLSIRAAMALLDAP